MSIDYNISHSEPIPLYIQIRENLKHAILEGTFEPGEKLPSEEELAACFGVSRMTVRQGLTELINANLLYRRHGQGTFVAKQKIDRDHTQLTDFFLSCLDRGLQPRAAVLRRDLIPASETVAEALCLSLDEMLIRIETVRFVDEVPITVHCAQLPLSLFPQLYEADLSTLGLEKRHLWDVMAECGVRVAHAQERLEARLADSYLADLLDIEQGAPILYGERIIYADDGRPVKYADCYNRGDRFSLTVSMSR